MCGITAVYSRGSPLTSKHIAILDRMTRDLHHRGPSYQSVIRCDEYTALGATRLPIVDRENTLANQPIISESHSITLAYNGNISEHLKLRQLTPHYRFKTKCDTETLLALIQETEHKEFDRLDGMWALAYYDSNKRKLVLARDRVGQKPLFYAVADDIVYVCSELQTLLRFFPQKTHFDNSVLSEILCHRFAIGEDTHIKEIKKVPNGCSLIFSGHTVTAKMLPPLKVACSNELITEMSQASTILQEQLLRACGDLYPAELPCALLLSGGLDSSAILSCLKKLELPIHTYSFKFLDTTGSPLKTVDESVFAEEVANHFKVPFTSVCVEKKDFFSRLKSWAHHVGEPPCFQNDGVCLQILFAEVAKTARIALCGAGADELFDGYASDSGVIFGDFFDQAQENNTLEAFAYNYARAWCRASNVNLSMLLSQYESAVTSIAKKIIKSLEPYATKNLSPRQLSHLAMVLTRLDGFEMAQCDRASMRESVEVRSPFLQKGIIETAMSYNPILNTQRTSKAVLKHALSHMLPPAVLQRQKFGFPIPPSYLQSQEFFDFVAPTLETGSELNKAGLINLETCRRLWNANDINSRGMFSRLAMLEEILHYQSSIGTQ